ncbi:hypothetical protein [Nitrosomonas marina]|uniref:Uncharacterized protein n=1 Tax=Nitrosomonas marina TaxID=917 RepID=A0A1H8FWL1_9PROT|nr:hypothetical protein [Nitrosomonas marina]SEN36039.1 hypothetical protein SAMN05216325_11516 [Nitrosomonas marina]
MSFDDLLTDSVKLLKKNGQIYEGIKASIQKNKIYIQRSDLLIEMGDLIQRNMSNGAEETYKVVDPGYHEKFHDIPAGYQMYVSKLGIPEAKQAVQNITYNISGMNTRINQNSVDNSVNIVQPNTEIQGYIQSLRDEIKHLHLDSNDEKKAEEIIDAVEVQMNNKNPSKAVVETLLAALPQVGSIASIISIILSLLR